MEVKLSLVFTALTPPINLDDTFTFLDVLESDDVQSDVKITARGKAEFRLDIPANDTALFILQPDIGARNGELLQKTNFEVRGYVEIFLSPLSPNSGNARILVNPEQRATFFKDITTSDPQLDQIVYNLPTATGKSLYTLKKGDMNGRIDDDTDD